MAARILGQIRIPTGGYSFTIQRTDGVPGPVRTITIPAGHYWWSNDAAADDLSDVIQDQVTAFAEFAMNFVFVVFNDGRIGMRLVTPGNTATITWTSTTLRDWMRYSGATTGLTAIFSYGARQAAFAFYPGRLYSECRWVYAETSAQSKSDTGNVQTHHYASCPRLVLGLQWPGGPYAAAWNEYHALHDLWTQALSKGRPCRIYRDLAVLTPYAEQSNPLGYSYGVKVEPKDWEPLPAVAGWYDAWQSDFVFQLTTE